MLCRDILSFHDKSLRFCRFATNPLALRALGRPHTNKKGDNTMTLEEIEQKIKGHYHRSIN
jgi:hypothetical protein